MSPLSSNFSVLSTIQPAWFCRPPSMWCCAQHWCFQCAARALKYFRITWEDSYKCSSVYICTTSNTQQQKCLKYITQKRTRMKCSTNVFSKQGASHLLQSEVATVNRPAVHKNFQAYQDSCETFWRSYHFEEIFKIFHWVWTWSKTDTPCSPAFPWKKSFTSISRGWTTTTIVGFVVFFLHYFLSNPICTEHISRYLHFKNYQKISPAPSTDGMPVNALPDSHRRLHFLNLLIFLFFNSRRASGNFKL